VPACGFSYGLERLDLATGQKDATRHPHVLVVGVAPEDHAVALGVAGELRGIDGVVVEQELRLRGVKSALRYADRASIDLVVIVGERERAEGVAVVRDMRSRDEQRVLRSDVRGIVEAALA
jgi:histidyl-tRNA synthetase